MRKCSTCKLELGIENFSRNKRIPDGYNRICRKCHKDYRRKHYLAHKVKYKNKARNFKLQETQEYTDFKKLFSCPFCGEDFEKCLEFHHLEDKKYVVSLRKGTVSLLELLKEIDKCILLCANCHRKVHYKIIDINSDENKLKISEWKKDYSVKKEIFIKDYLERMIEYRKLRTLV